MNNCSCHCYANSKLNHPRVRARKALLNCWYVEGYADPYLVVFANGDSVSMSANPMHPQGVCCYDTGFKFHKEQPETLGSMKRVTFQELPEDCKRLVLKDLGIV
jgi:hypothetical protein